MPETGEYKIYSEGACDTLISTGITVNYIKSKTIKVTKINFINDSICTDSPFDTIIISIESEPTGDIQKSFLLQDGNAIEFASCSYESLKITCSTVETITDGTFTLKDIEGEDSFTIDQTLNSLSYKASPISKEQKIEQSVMKTNPSFYITKRTADATEPIFYVDNKVIDCVNENETNWKCTPTNKNMPEEKEYEIDYGN